MNPFVRLQDGDGSDAERLLLASALEDAPSPGARERTLVALGVVAGAAVVAPGAVHAAVNVASGGASAKAAGTMTALVLAKWLGTGALVGAITAACIATATTPGLLLPAHASRAATVSPTPAAPRTPGHATPRSVPEPDRAPIGATMDGEREPSGVPGATGATATPPGRNAEADELAPTGAGEAPADPARAPMGAPGNASNVLAEVASLDRARAALATGDAEGALDRLATHERRFPGGALEPEAVVLRVRAWLKLGRRAEAIALVNRFLAAHPESSQSTRLRALVGSQPR